MRSGNLAQVDSQAIYRESASKQDDSVREEMLALESRVFEAYAAYDMNLAIDSGLRWSEVERELLQCNWPKISNTSLRGEVLSSTGGICAYCGTTAAAQLDHYLPKSVFGEYSVHVSNLIPSCGPCNGHKAQRYELPLGGRRYAHPFLFPLPSIPLLNVELVIDPSVSVSFSVNESACDEAGILEIMNQQFEDLHLNSLFVTEAVAYLSDRMAVYEEEYESEGGGGVLVLLERDRRAMVRSRGLGHWAVALLDCLMASAEFCSGGFRRIVQLAA